MYYSLLNLGVNYIVSNISGFLVSILNAYFLNSKYVFLKNNNHKILNSIDIEIKEKEFLGIVGESGSGKTTLLNSIISFLSSVLNPLKDLLRLSI